MRARAASGKLPESSGQIFFHSAPELSGSLPGVARARLIFLQRLILLESEKKFTLKAVSGFDLEKHCQGLAILRNN